MDKTGAIHRNEQDGDWYIYLQCFPHENSKRAYKNTKKNCKLFKLDKNYAVRIGPTAIKPYISYMPSGLSLVPKVNAQPPSFSYGRF